jgi:hypothetical protein
MKLLRRILLLALCLGLMGAVVIGHLNSSRISYGHDTLYVIKWPWIHEVREWSLYGILGWCLLFARSETTFVRIGLITIGLAFIIMSLPFRVH